MTKMNGFTFERISDAHTENIRVNSKAMRVTNPEVIIHPSKCVMPSEFVKEFSRIYDFEVFPDDVWVVTYPKSGTTWTQEMVWLLRNKLDFQAARNTHLVERFPFLEGEAIIASQLENKGVLTGSIAKATNLKRPRCIKSHLPLELLPKGIWTVKPKIIYVSRDPRDVAISYYHHYRLWNGYQGTLEDFTEGFLADRHVYSPFWSHNLSFWTLKDKSHVLINSYEDMKRDLSSVIKKTAQFMDVDVTDEEIKKLKDHLAFKEMRENDSVNYSIAAREIKSETKILDVELVFMRKGGTGYWNDTYSKGMIAKFREWMEAHLKGMPLQDHPYSSKC